jgi:hypothetical protein
MWWYRQNLYFYMTKPAADELLGSGRIQTDRMDPRLEIIGSSVLDQYTSFRGLIRMTGEALVRALRSRSAGLITKD